MKSQVERCLGPGLSIHFHKRNVPWLVWLSGLSTGLQTRRLFDSRSEYTPGWRAGSRVGGVGEDPDWCFSSSFSLPSPSRNK